MRELKALAFVVALFAACATTDGGGGDDGEDPPPTGDVCGDAVCAASEIGSCTADCGTGGNGNNEVCGNATCEGNEPSTCPSDCGGGGGGAVCGNGTCEMAAGENSTNCAGDCSASGGTCPADPTECLLCLVDPLFCPSGLDQATCQACALGGGGTGTGCTGGVPNGMCETGEDATNCPLDCM